MASKPIGKLALTRDTKTTYKMFLGWKWDEKKMPIVQKYVALRTNSGIILYKDALQ